MDGGPLAAHRVALLRFAIRLVGDGPLAEDIVQEAMLRAHAARSPFEGRATTGTWLAAIALNVIRDRFRGAAARMEVPADAETLAGLPSGQDIEQEVSGRCAPSICRHTITALSSRPRETDAALQRLASPDNSSGWLS